MSDSERRLAAVMFTDIVGYTHMTQANESLALELLQEHQRLLRPAFAAHGGTEVKTIGDAFLVEFRSALEAVLCAVEMQKRMDERNREVAPSRRLELRIGIHVGDVVHGQDDIFGDAVNVASRIEPLAEPGGVCFSQQVFDQIRNKTPLAIEKVGDVKLKNVDLPLGVYKVNLKGGRRPEGERQFPKERVGVLPFVNISPDPNDEYFADGLTEELIGKLSEVKGLKVIARTSVMSYKRKDKKVSEIAAELGVGSIIEGSVRKASNQVRITVQLIDPRTEEHLWSSNYDNKLDDIFAIQSDVASRVAASLSAGFFSRQERRDTDDIEAYTLYLKAVQLSYEWKESSMRETVALLRRAIEMDPDFARAHAALSSAWHKLAVTGCEDFAAMAKKAEVEAVRSVELDPELAEAHAAMANVHTMFDRFDQALGEAEAAVRLKSNLSAGYMALGILDCNMRTPAEALRMFREAYNLDPLSPGTAEILASFAGWVGEDALARDVLDRLREFNPRNPRVYLSTADYYMERRDFEEAWKMVEAARALEPGEPMIALSEGLLFAFEGKRREAEGALEELRRSDTESFRLLAELDIQAALGNLDGAFKALMRQAETHSWPFQIMVDPLFAGMRKDPRFAEFCRKVGIRPGS